jgi:hypothetical protein
VPVGLGVPGVVDTVIGSTHPSRFRKSTTSTSCAPRVSVDHDTVCPVVMLISAGAVTGPWITATGGDPKLPLLTAVPAPGGGAAARLNGTRNGTTMSPPPPDGSGVITTLDCAAAYFLGSGATNPTVKVTSHNVGYASVTCPDLRT